MCRPVFITCDICWCSTRRSLSVSANRKSLTTDHCEAPPAIACLTDGGRSLLCFRRGWLAAAAAAAAAAVCRCHRRPRDRRSWSVAARWTSRAWRAATGVPRSGTAPTTRAGAGRASPPAGRPTARPARRDSDSDQVREHRPSTHAHIHTHTRTIQQLLKSSVWSPGIIGRT